MKRKLEPLPSAEPPVKPSKEESDSEDDVDSDALEYDSETGEIAGKTSTEQDDGASDSDSEDDDDDDVNDDTLGGGTLKMSKHKRDMDKLKESDPEFFKYLESADKELLDFEASDEEDIGEEMKTDEEDDDDDDDEDDDESLTANLQMRQEKTTLECTDSRCIFIAKGTAKGFTQHG